MRELKVMRIHVSAPGDVREERDALAQVVAELETTTAEHYGLALQLVRWEDSAVHAFGRPQELINRQIPDSDIFVGILWSRFGTPTSSETSGTEEEIGRALSSWQLLGRPHVLLYFCERAVSPSRVDLEQVSRILNFRKSIAERQLVSTFVTVDEFRSKVLADLARLVQTLAQHTPAKRPPRIFYSYAHEDERLREELAKHLRVLERNHVIESWYDDMIVAGAEWSNEIADQLEKADIVILLVSSDFLDSDYCYKVEMRRALDRHKAGNVSVIPVIVRSALWEESPLADLKALPKDGRPVTLWENRDEAWVDVARGIKRVASSLSARCG